MTYNDRKKKGLVLILVEGESDQKIFYPIFEQLCAQHHPNTLFRLTLQYPPSERCPGGDVFSQYSVQNYEIEERIIQFVLKPYIMKYLGSEPEEISRIKELIIITDSDGCFANNNHRNKRINLMLMLQKQKVQCSGHNIPVKIYYVSRDLEHLCHNQLKVEQYKKNLMARQFVKEHPTFNQIDSFLSPFYVNDTYQKTWSYLQEGTNSEKRKTNLNVLFDKLKENKEDQSK